MFSALRIILIVGVIFYFSPVRNPADGLGFRARTADSGQGQSSVSPSDSSARLEALWDALPERAKQSIVDRIVTSAAGSAGPATTPARFAGPTDTLEPEDLQPTWKGDAKRKP